MQTCDGGSKGVRSNYDLKKSILSLSNSTVAIHFTKIYEK